MRLKKLQLYGFKSFAQRTEIVFNEGITGIVGPNGSGKSNIGDAVRWVLGEQSAKTLRGASMADVIFNGTQKRKPLTYCEVSLIFDNDDRALAMDYAEVMVTRRVYRNGDSEYFLNRNSCRLRDIIDLFRDTGIGKEGYSIIGQGRIDEILSRRGEDRRQVFEEAAGIVKFKARKEEADRKLQHTLQNADRIDDILDELRRQLKPLQEQARVATAYVEMATQLKDLDLNLFLIRSDKARTRLAELDTELMNLRSVLDVTETALAEKTISRDETQNTIAVLEEKLTAARNGLLACVEQVHEAQNLLAAVESRRQARSEHRAQLQEERREAIERLQQLEQVFLQANENADAQMQLLQDAEQLLERAKQAAEKAAEEEENAENELEEHKAELLRMINRQNARQNDQTRLRTMRGQMEQRLAQLRSGIQEQQKQAESLQQASDKAADLLAEEYKTLAALQQTLTDKKNGFALKDGELLRLRGQFDRMNAALQASRSRHRLLTEMTRDMEGYNQSVRRAVQHAGQSGIHGVRGVLTQLIRVPQAYETAIDMALGAAQQNIVTETEQTAKVLIDYLRQNKLGRATFLPMSAVRGKVLNSAERKALSMRGCVGIASELIEYDDEYRDIVESLLGRTVIAEDLNCGIAIMRACGHAFRLVTMQGDVMHSGGSMTGGSTQSRMVNLLSRERELKELTEAIAADEKKLDDMRARMQSVQAEKEKLRNEGNEALQAVHQQQIAVAREQEHADNADNELNAHQERIDRTNEAITQIEESVEDITAQLEELDQETGGADDMQQMEAKTPLLQQALAEARNASAAAGDQVMSRTLQLAELRHRVETLVRDRTRFEQDKQQAERDDERRAMQLQQMAQQELADAAQAADASAKTEIRKLEQTRQEAVIAALEQHRSDEQNKLRDILTDMENLHQSYSRDSDHVHRTQLSRARVENDLKQQQDYIWNAYELTYAGAEEFRTQDEFDAVAADRRAAQLQSHIRALGPVNTRAVEEYADTKERYDELERQQQDLRAAEQDIRELIDRLLEQMRTTFVENFTKLQAYFSETFVRLFGGGHAELKLTDPDDPLNCGIEVNAQPPGKKLQLLSLLSGGERALTAIAILFATLKLKPSPFCILDEIEAALDDANIGYYADYLKEYSQSTQFIVVTHRKGTMERCDSLYGVAMEEQGVSKMVSVSLQDYKE